MGMPGNVTNSGDVARLSKKPDNWTLSHIIGELREGVCSEHIFLIIMLMNLYAISSYQTHPPRQWALHAAHMVNINSQPDLKHQVIAVDFKHPCGKLRQGKCQSSICEG